MVEPLELGRFISTCRKEKKSDAEAAGRRTGRDRQSISRPAVRKEVEK